MSFGEGFNYKYGQSATAVSPVAGAFSRDLDNFAFTESEATIRTKLYQVYDPELPYEKDLLEKMPVFCNKRKGVLISDARLNLHLAEKSRQARDFYNKVVSAFPELLNYPLEQWRNNFTQKTDLSKFNIDERFNKDATLFARLTNGANIPEGMYLSAADVFEDWNLMGVVMNIEHQNQSTVPAVNIACDQRFEVVNRWGDVAGHKTSAELFLVVKKDENGNLFVQPEYSLTGAPIIVKKKTGMDFNGFYELGRVYKVGKVLDRQKGSCKRNTAYGSSTRDIITNHNAMGSEIILNITIESLPY
jgi:hypothetical protein